MSMTAHLLGLLMVVMVAIACYQKTDCPEKQRKCYLLPPRSGADCGVVTKRYSFDPAMKKCVEYDYGGCGGNLNSFYTMKKCKEECPELVAQCPVGYSDVKGKCYHHRNESVDNPTAMEQCKRSSNGYLAAFKVGESRAEFNKWIRMQIGEELDYVCNKAMDVVFLIDTSDSMMEMGLTSQIEFIRSFVSNFEFGPGKYQSQFAVMDTSKTGDFMKIHLNDHNNAADFSNALNLEFPDFTGRAEFPYLGLRRTRTDILLPENGARANVETIVIMISDGDRQKPAILLEEAALLKKAGVKLFFILVEHKYSIGPSHPDWKIFGQVVSSPSEDYMFLLEHTSALNAQISTLITTICWDKIEMWIGRSHEIVTTNTQGVCTIMNAAFTTVLRPKEEHHEVVCQAEMVYAAKPE